MNGESDGRELVRVRWGRFWQIVGLVVAIYVIEQDGEALLRDGGLLSPPGFEGVDLQPDVGALAGELRVLQVAPGAAFAKAGVTTGDQVLFDRPYDHIRRLSPGERVAFAVQHGAMRFHRDVEISTRPASETAPIFSLLYELSVLVPALLGTFMLLRSQGRLTPALLGAALASFGVVSYLPQMWESKPSTFLVFYVVGYSLLWLTSVLFPVFALSFINDMSGGVGRKSRLLLAAYSAALAVAIPIGCFAELNPGSLPFLGDGGVLFALTGLPGIAICLFYLTQSYRSSMREARQRYGYLLLGFGAVVISQALNLFSESGLIPTGGVASPSQLMADLLSGLIAPVLFSYAILRHKALDIGFAVNRTLVYTSVSTILLVGFGLVEWALDHFVKIEGREKNAFIDAGVALAVFLCFHRVRDVVEHLIEKLMFRRWHEAEENLRRFIEEAAHIASLDALAAACIRNIGRFVNGAQVALYMRGEDGSYALQAGGLGGVPNILNADDPTIVALRASPSPLEESREGSVLTAALSLPMVNRHEVTGLILLGQKPDGGIYRPDELKLLDWAVRQLGADFRALKVEQLESLGREQRRELDQRGREIQLLMQRSSIGVENTATA